MKDRFLSFLRVLAVAAVLSVLMASVSFGGEKTAYLSGPDKVLYVDAGALEELSHGYSYSRDEVQDMLKELDKTGESGLISAADDVYVWNQSTGADVAAMCALICSEGSLNNMHGKEHWNFFVLPLSKGDSSYTAMGTRRLWDAKAECETLGEALVLGMEKIRMTYWEKGQDTFYKMSFNDYGVPKNRQEAEKRVLSHSYLPYYEDLGYISSGYDSGHAWVNRMASYRRRFNRG